MKEQTASFLICTIPPYKESHKLGMEERQVINFAKW